MRRPSFLPLALATICGLTAPAIPGRTQVALEAVSREEAVRLALERNPAAVGARGATRVAEAGVLEARGEWLPSLNANSTYSNSSNTRFDQLATWRRWGRSATRSWRGSPTSSSPTATAS